MEDSKPSSGLFVTLYDWDTLNLYLEHGLYGFLMTPEYDEVSPYSRHYAALADYACGREGTHVFFFLKRHIVYGGELIGPSDWGCFYLNGQYSPMGRKADAEIYWNESSRECYKPTEKKGIFEVKTQSGWKDKCQPFLVRFDDKLGLKGRAITSDDLYFELGSYPYPLPSNSIQGMGFCTLTPGETNTLLDLLKGSTRDLFDGTSEEVELEGSPLPFKPKFGISGLEEVETESHMEASVLANPNILPEILRPSGSTLCRQVPVSPFKPSQMDKADICYYSKNLIENGTIPNTVIELKNRKAGKREAEQIARYLRWLGKVVPSHLEKIRFYLFAPDYTSTVADYLPTDKASGIDLVHFDGTKQISL